MSQPLVSILVLAWNHGPFIRQALDSLVAQQCSFPFEILVGEDCSSDDTRVVCEQVQALYPELVRLLPATANLGMHANFARLWQQARGEYVAFCEGDDYWSDTGKLAAQVDFLQQHPECTMVGALTEVLVQDAAGQWQVSGLIAPEPLKETYGFEDLITGYGFHFSSVLLRKSAVSFPEWFQRMYCVDRPLWLLAAQRGRAGLLQRRMSVYRLHPGGNWSALAAERKAAGSIALFDCMRLHFDPRYVTLFEQTLGSILWSYMAQELVQGRKQAARRLFRLALRHSSWRQLTEEPLLHLKVLARLYLPLPAPHPVLANGS